MSRCAGCNTILHESEIIWRHNIGQWEDLCRKCRHHALDIPKDDIETMDALDECLPDLEEVPDETIP